MLKVPKIISTPGQTSIIKVPVIKEQQKPITPSKNVEVLSSEYHKGVVTKIFYQNNNPSGKIEWIQVMIKNPDKQNKYVGVLVRKQLQPNLDTLGIKDLFTIVKLKLELDNQGYYVGKDMVKLNEFNPIQVGFNMLKSSTKAKPKVMTMKEFGSAMFKEYDTIFVKKGKQGLASEEEVAAHMLKTVIKNTGLTAIGVTNEQDPKILLE